MTLVSETAPPAGAVVDGAAPRRTAQRRTPSRRPRWLLSFAVPVATLLLWELLARRGLVNARLMPPPSRVVATLFALARSGELATHVGATLTRVGLGFALGAGIGSLAAAAVGTSSLLRVILDPTVQALRAIPSIAWVPLFILWLGIFEASKVALIAVGVFFPVYLGLLDAILGVDRRIVEVGRAFGLGRVALARRVLLPSVLPAWITALRAGLGLGFMFVVAAEIMGASEGVGYLLLDGQQVGKPDQIIAAILVFAVLGQAADALLKLCAAPLLRWQDLARERL